jgi:stalled ribosome rescue protein Dom34
LLTLAIVEKENTSLVKTETEDKTDTMVEVISTESEEKAKLTALSGFAAILIQT